MEKKKNPVRNQVSYKNWNAPYAWYGSLVKFADKIGFINEAPPDR